MIKNSKLSRYKLLKVVDCFCIDIDATKSSQLLQLNRNTTNRYFNVFRELIAAHQRAEKEQFVGVVEVDESFFGPARVRGRPGPRKRGRGTYKQPVFGIYERNGRVYTELVTDCSAKTLQRIIRGRINPESVVHTDGWRGYDGLVDVGFDKHLRINKSKHFASKGVHINGIEAFWSFTKRRLSKFNGVKKNFELHLKECEWRYGKSTDQLRQELWNMIVDFKKS
ncbi:MAG: IS1595 family transposase [Gammaproteobacteria bacterium]|nr:IS1595 family transposase [Gammaproteobacteria bacterium]NIR92347.1 IS1595 family transposase [Gammaproteobacteria bacterium]